ncbi:hypothetical protein Fmac_021184 [Flemingia macrophylla]|uniref:Receptor-like serine/threonine-protein kinase n=1 Tax=Flemingia macrophylla TaxID=520843 RepID=A0ABD1LW65_9FABA
MITTSTSVDTLSMNQSLQDGETLVSARGVIEVGFFSPENSTRRHLGIWYTNVSPFTVVWVANRNTPLESKSGVLKLNEKGILVLLNGSNNTIWSSNIASKAGNNPIAHLLDSGNFVVKNEQETNNFLWQSFDEIGDTMIPGMKLGWNIEIGLQRCISSWKSANDPAEGKYTLKLDRKGYPQVVIFKGSEIKVRIGPWNGQSWAGYPVTSDKSLQKFVFNEKEVYYEFELLDSSDFNIFILTPSGTGSGIFWTSETSTRQVLSTGEEDQCENYAFCGENSICNYDAYANLDIRDGGSGCLLWFNTLVDLRNFSQLGQDFYIRVPASELGAASRIYNKHYKSKLRKEDIDLPTFDLSVLVNATENFSTENKLGEGGFGPVYKVGTLRDEKELAVKRLSKKSGQGLDEFKNEVGLIAKLQHRNLVKLLDETKRKFLDWHKRFNIISGIARGLLYLHQDSRLRIIHRDIKTSNILLDANLDPKISDFGLARSFLGDQVEANTKKIAGTYGYISPEYAARGYFSPKSDVFSYGVIVLEIVSGKKNREFSDPEHYNNLLGHAWRLWTEERALELLDDVLGDQCVPTEVTRCIQVGLLCVQQRPEDRPDMSSVVLILNGDKYLSPKPKVPGFYTETNVTSEANSSSENHKLCSVNELSITMLDARLEIKARKC